MSTNANSNNMNSDNVRMLLNIARSKIEGESPNDALAALLHAICLTQGEEAIMNVLEVAKRNVDADADAVSEEDAMEAAHRMLAVLVRDESTLLYERGEEHILRDAFQDGSSVVCIKCSSLIPRARFLQHQLYWCEQNENEIEGEI
jgi:hypothetical protein